MRQSNNFNFAWVNSFRSPRGGGPGINILSNVGESRFETQSAIEKALKDFYLEQGMEVDREGEGYNPEVNDYVVLEDEWIHAKPKLIYRGEKQGNPQYRTRDAEWAEAAFIPVQQQFYLFINTRDYNRQDDETEGLVGFLREYKG